MLPPSDRLVAFPFLLPYSPHILSLIFVWAADVIASNRSGGDRIRSLGNWFLFQAVATPVEEATQLERVGVDAVAAQGTGAVHHPTISRSMAGAAPA